MSEAQAALEALVEHLGKSRKVTWTDTVEALTLINVRAREIRAETESLRAERDALAAFKAFVHRRLDTAGVPTHPAGPHSKEGCRIGDRLDLVVGARDTALDLLEEWDRWEREAHAACTIGNVEEPALPPSPLERTRTLLVESGRSLIPPGGDRG